MSFLEQFQILEDPRSHINRKHDLLDIVFLTISAILSGSEGWEGIEVRRIRHHKNKISEETQYYISSLPLDAEQAGHAI